MTLTAAVELVKRNAARASADILALREESKILGRCLDVLKVVTCLQFSLWVSPHRLTQCSKTGLKMSDWKCEILTEPSNVQESYSPPAEQGYHERSGSAFTNYDGLSSSQRGGTLPHHYFSVEIFTLRFQVKRKEV